MTLPSNSEHFLIWDYLSWMPAIYLAFVRTCCISTWGILQTSLFLAEPSNMASMQLQAMAAHKFNRTFTLGHLSCLQKTNVTAMVIRTANNEMEQPIIDMISKAFLLGNEVFKKTWELVRMNHCILTWPEYPISVNCNVLIKSKILRFFAKHRLQSI